MANASSHNMWNSNSFKIYVWKKYISTIDKSSKSQKSDILLQAIDKFLTQVLQPPLLFQRGTGYEPEFRVSPNNNSSNNNRLEKTDNNIRMLERVIWMEVGNARIAYKSASIKVAEQERNLNLAQRIYDTTQIKYREGVGSSLEITQAEQALFQSQQNLQKQ